jgi:hypothetical protein
MQKISRGFSGQPTDRGELLEMVVTPDRGNRELVQEEKRQGLLTTRLEGGPTCVTPNGRKGFGQIRPGLL